MQGRCRRDAGETHLALEHLEEHIKGRIALEITSDDNRVDEISNHVFNLPTKLFSKQPILDPLHTSSIVRHAVGVPTAMSTSPVCRCSSSIQAQSSSVYNVALFRLLSALSDPWRSLLSIRVSASPENVWCGGLVKSVFIFKIFAQTQQ